MPIALLIEVLCILYYILIINRATHFVMQHSGGPDSDGESDIVAIYRQIVPARRFRLEGCIRVGSRSGHFPSSPPFKGTTKRSLYYITISSLL